MDLAIAIAGELADLSALATTQYPEIEAGADGDKRLRTTFDHLLLHSQFKQSGTLSIEVFGGQPPETPFALELVGEARSSRLRWRCPARLPSGFARALDWRRAVARG